MDVPEPAPKKVAELRAVLAEHKNSPDTGLCTVCAVPRCPQWTDAYDRLARAGQAMLRPSQQPWPLYRQSARGPDQRPSGAGAVTGGQTSTPDLDTGY